MKNYLTDLGSSMNTISCAWQQRTPRKRPRVSSGASKIVLVDEEGIPSYGSTVLERPVDRNANHGVGDGALTCTSMLANTRPSASANHWFFRYHPSCVDMLGVSESRCS